MYVKPVDVDTRDVFLGKGWENWVRYRKVAGFWKRVGGLSPNYETEQQILRRLDSWGSNHNHQKGKQQ